MDNNAIIYAENVLFNKNENLTVEEVKNMLIDAYNAGRNNVGVATSEDTKDFGIDNDDYIDLDPIPSSFLKNE